MFLGKYLETKKIDHHLLLFVHFVYQKKQQRLSNEKMVISELFSIYISSVVLL